ncbi:MAG: gliding motility-associated C-terminal domain-containing protein, partial [Saprospiraceae bacterium]|nr:gliding motility-associated C-terminal domain-containing protein [Saprospiraceae bacterium]
ESCSTIDSTFINYSISEDIYIPNAFSPNDDGFNDLFEIYSKEENTKIVTLKIFDRWGGLVHEANNMSIGDSRYAWNGALRGKKMPTGIYIYYVEVILSDQISKVLKGDVLLMR